MSVITYIRECLSKCFIVGTPLTTKFMSQNHLKLHGNRPGLADHGHPDKIEQPAAGPDKVEKAVTGPDKFELAAVGPDKVE